MNQINSILGKLLTVVAVVALLFVATATYLALAELFPVLKAALSLVAGRS